MLTPVIVGVAVELVLDAVFGMEAFASNGAAVLAPFTPQAMISPLAGEPVQFAVTAHPESVPEVLAHQTSTSPNKTPAIACEPVETLLAQVSPQPETLETVGAALESIKETTAVTITSLVLAVVIPDDTMM